MKLLCYPLHSFCGVQKIKNSSLLYVPRDSRTYRKIFQIQLDLPCNISESLLDCMKPLNFSPRINQKRKHTNNECSGIASSKLPSV